MSHRNIEYGKQGYLRVSFRAGFDMFWSSHSILNTAPEAL